MYIRFLKYFGSLVNLYEFAFSISIPFMHIKGFKHVISPHIFSLIMAGSDNMACFYYYVCIIYVHNRVTIDLLVLH